MSCTTGSSSEARERAGDAFERAWAEGRSLSVERAVALAVTAG